MSDALVGVLIGGVIGLFGSVLVQVIVTWREDRLHKQEHNRSIRSLPLDNLLSVVNSVTSVTTQHIFATALRSAGKATNQFHENLLSRRDIMKD